jgi:hypothetical protein
MARIWNLCDKPIELIGEHGEVQARWPVAGRVRVSREERTQGELTIGRLQIPVVAHGETECSITGFTEDELLQGDVLVALEGTVGALKRHFAGRVRVLRAEGRVVGDALRVEKLVAS